MSNLEKEAAFFNDIAAKVRSLVLSFDGKASVSVQKRIGDYATEVDIAVENLIVSEIQSKFPSDLILAEEGHNTTKITNGRIWIIDPICGTTNIGRGLKTFCTNIALADDNTLIASCVIDHSQNDFFWSVGDNKVFINESVYEPVVRPEGFGLLIDIDMGSVGNVDGNTLEQYSKFLRELFFDKNYMTVSLNSSLGFAYSAVGKFDGFVNIYNHPWDICASSFLIQQVGGVITDLKGNPWNIQSVGAIAAANPSVHKLLVHSYNNRSES